MNIYKEFQLLSQDYLKLMGDKSRRANINKQIAEELGTMEFFYEGVKSLMDKYEEQTHELKLRVINANTTMNIIKKMYEDDFKRSIVDKIGKKTPTPKEWELIKKRRKDGATLNDITKHFELSKNQIITLADAT